MANKTTKPNTKPKAAPPAKITNPPEGPKQQVTKKVKARVDSENAEKTALKAGTKRKRSRRNTIDYDGDNNENIPPNGEVGSKTKRQKTTRGKRKAKGPNVGEWPTGGPFHEHSGAIHSKLRKSTKTVEEAVQERIGILKSVLKNIKQYPQLKHHTASIRAAITAYEKDPESMEQSSFWIDGKKVTKKEAKGKAAWMEFLNLDDIIQCAIIPPDRVQPLAQEDCHEAVFELHNETSGTGFEFEPAVHYRPGHYKAKLILRYMPEYDCIPKPTLPKPSDNPLDLSVEAAHEWHSNHGRVVADAVFDTGATLGGLTAQAMRDLETYFEFRGWDGAVHVISSDGHSKLRGIRVIDYAFLHWTSLSPYTGWRQAVFTYPLNYATHQEADPGINLVGCNMMSDYHFIKTRGITNQNGLSHIKRSRLFQAQYMEPDFMQEHRKPAHHLEK